MNTDKYKKHSFKKEFLALLTFGFCFIWPSALFGQNDGSEPVNATLCPVYDLKIVKLVDSSVAAPGSIITYTLRVSNSGISDIGNVSVTDGMPAYLTYIDGSVTMNGQYSSIYKRLSWEIELIEAGKTIEVSYQTMIDPQTPPGTEILNTAKITQPDFIYSNVAVTKVRTPLMPLLQIVKVVDKATAMAADTLTYALTITNSGNACANNVGVSDNIPDYTSYIPNSVSGGGQYNSGSNSINWNFPAVEAGQSVTSGFRVIIDDAAPDGSDIANIGSIILADSLVSDTVMTRVLPSPRPDLGIIKSVDKLAAFAGDTLEYTLTISNVGTAPALSVEISDTIPEFVTYVVGSASDGTYDSNIGLLNWELPNLEPGESINLEFLGVINIDVPANSVIMNIGAIDMDNKVRSDTVNTVVLHKPVAILEISKEVDRVSAFAGDTLEYTLTISNIGDLAAEDIEVIDNIPEHTTFIPESAAGSIFDQGTLSWVLPTVEPDQSITLNFRVTIDLGTIPQTEISNFGSIIRPDEKNSNTVKTIVQPFGEPRIYIDKQVDKSTAYRGDTLIYTMILWNGSEVAAENVNVVDNIPDYTTYVQGSAADGVYDPELNQFTWALENIEPYEDISLSFAVVIEDHTPPQTVITNIGTVVSPGHPDSDEASTVVVPGTEPRLFIEKQVDKLSAYPGDTLTYTLIIWNGGEGDAVNIMVQDEIPENAGYISGTASGGNYDPDLKQLNWTIDHLASNEEAYLSFQVTINPGTPEQTAIINVGRVISPGRPDSDEVRTIVMAYPGPKLYIEKQVDKSSAFAGDTLNYTLIVSNVSTIAAENVMVEDYIPDYLTYVPGSAFGGTYDSGENLLSWTISSLDWRYPAYLSFRAVIDIDTPDQTEIINTGSIVLAEEQISDDARTTVIPRPEPELGIIKQVDKSAAYAGDTLTYTLTMSNESDWPVENVTIEDYIPELTTYVSGSATGGVYDADAGLLNWTIDVLAPHSPVSVGFQVIIDGDAPANSEIVNTGSIVLPNREISDEIITTVLPVPDYRLKISKEVDKAAVFAGDTLLYSLTISNTGALGFEAVEVLDPIPANAYYLAGSIYGDGAFDLTLNRISWQIGFLEPGQSIEVGFKAVVDAIYGGNAEIVNIGSIIFPDSVLSDTTITEILPGTPDLQISKSVDKQTAYAGDTLSYNLEVTNAGTGFGESVNIIDVIPEYSVFVYGSIVGSGLYDAALNRIVWSSEMLAPGESIELSFRVVVDLLALENMEIRNIGTIYFPDESQSADTVITTVIKRPAPQLSIIKEVNAINAYPGNVLTYTLRVVNSGDLGDEAVHVIDIIPENATYVDGSISGGGNYDAQSNMVDWTISVPAESTSDNLTFSVIINENTPAQTEIENIGSILFPDERVISDSVTTIVLQGPNPNLHLVKEVDLTSAYAGDILTYTLRVANSGDIAGWTTGIFDQIPEHTAYIDNSASGGGLYDPESNSISWSVLVPENGSSPALTFQVAIDDAVAAQTEIMNIGSIIFPNEGIISDTVKTLVLEAQAPELSIDKVVSLSSAFADDTLSYTLTVSNAGPVVPEEIMVIDAIPDHTILIPGTITGNGFYNSTSGQIEWTVNDLSIGGTVDLGFRVAIESGTLAQTVIANIGRIISPGEPVSDTVNTIVMERPEPEIEITKQVDSLIAAPGSVLTYVLQIANTGNEPIRQIIAWDKIPLHTTYVANSATSGGTYDDVTGQINWNWQVGSIAPGHAIDLSFKARINDNTQLGTEIINIGSAALPLEQFDFKKVGLSGDFETLDTVNSNEVITIVDIKTGEDDLTIFKEVSADYTSPGNILTYYITVSNIGEENINNISFSDTIPSFTTYVPGSATGGAIYDGITGSLSWSIGSLGSGQEEKYQFNVTVDEETPDAAVIANQAFIHRPISIAGNVVTTTVLRNRVSVVKSVDKFQVTLGDTLTYTIVYTNNSPAAVDNFIIIDTLPAGLNYIPGSASSGGLYNAINGTIVWRIRTIPAGASGSVYFSVEIDESVPNQDEIGNFVIFSGDDIPVDTSNLVVITILFPEMEMSKTVEPILTYPGDTITYTITALNDGASQLIDAVLIDNLPDRFEYVAGSATVDGVAVDVTGTDELTIPIGTMGISESAVIIYDVAIPLDADRSPAYVNSAILRGTGSSGRTLEFGPVHATVSLETPRLVIVKTADVASSIAGSFIPFTMTITNISNISVEDVIVIDSLPDGLFYVEGSTTINGSAAPDPTGINPCQWFVGDMASGATAILHYTLQPGTSTPSGHAENIAWAMGRVGSETVRSANASARVYILSTTLSGAIRGRIIVDCDGDGTADIDSIPSGIDIYLDDGSQSRINEKGMFYFSTVRDGEHLVALDTRDLMGYTIADGQDASVLVFVHEGGESYVTFRVCPDYPRLTLSKTAAVLPKVRVSKSADFEKGLEMDSNMVIVNYDILMETSEGFEPGSVMVVDSFPSNVGFIIHDNKNYNISETGNVLKYDIGDQRQQHLKQSVYYSMAGSPLDAGQFLTNKFYLQSAVIESEETTSVKSNPVEISVGPFVRIEAGEIDLHAVVAHFQTSKIDLWTRDLFKLEEIGDSINKYSDLDVKIEGHADYRRIHTKEFPSNWELSLGRARSVYDWYTEYYGIDSTRFRYEGFAATRPIDPGHTEDAWWKNRRTEVILSGHTNGGIKFSGDIRQKWSASTLIELKPTVWDTILTFAKSSDIVGLAETWEVQIMVGNIGASDANDLTISDKIPSGAIYLEGSASINGRPVAAYQDKNNNLIIGSGEIKAGQNINIRYRIKALENSRISGGGRAVIEIKRAGSGTMKQESNPIRFN